MWEAAWKNMASDGQCVPQPSLWIHVHSREKPGAQRHGFKQAHLTIQSRVVRTYRDQQLCHMESLHFEEFRKSSISWKGKCSCGASNVSGMERSRREDQACAYLAPPHHPLKYEKRPLQFPSLQTKIGCFIIQYQFHYSNDAARRRGLCSSIWTSVPGGGHGTPRPW